jgi:hypothetical protein
MIYGEGGQYEGDYYDFVTLLPESLTIYKII